MARMSDEEFVRRTSEVGMDRAGWEDLLDLEDERAAQLDALLAAQRDVRS